MQKADSSILDNQIQESERNGNLAQVAKRKRLNKN